MMGRLIRALGTFAAILCFLGGIVVYFPVLRHGIFIFDDNEYILGNPLIKDIQWSGSLAETRLVGYLSFALNYAIHGNIPFGFHLVNVIIHILNGLLVFMLVRHVMKPDFGRSPSDNGNGTVIAFFTCLIFIVHPVETQAVSYITQRFTSLCAFFYLAAVVFYLKCRTGLERRAGRRNAAVLYAGALLSTIFAMKTKENAATIPVILLLAEAFLFKGSSLGRRRFVFLVPFAALLPVIPISLAGPEWGVVSPGRGIDEIIRMDKLYDLYERSAREYFLTQIRVIVTYLRLLFLPMNQVVIYQYEPVRSLFEPRFILSALLLSVLAAGAFLSWRRAGRKPPEEASEFRLVTAGIIWFFVTLSVESSFIPIKDLIFEHRIYLPSVGIFSACSVFLVRVMRGLRLRLPGTAWTWAIAGLLLFLMGVLTLMRNEVWTDEMKFWDDAVRKSPDKPIGYNNRGTVYAKAGLYQEALRDFDNAISFFPSGITERLSWENADLTPSNMSKTYKARGDVFIALGDIDAAREDYRRAKDIMVLPFDIRKNLQYADMLSKKGRLQEAVGEYDRIIEWVPDHTDALNDRGNALSRMGRYAEAISDFDKVITLNPDYYLAYHNRGIAYSWAGDRKKASEDFSRACNMGFSPACESSKDVRIGRP